ncbi:MAG: molybdenum cofactor biosynthesis protein B [Euryarchaeota archaeon]|nr:molybdenum cofactor biosynthesis protein B [Euryarchaeota archaeon]
MDPSHVQKIAIKTAVITVSTSRDESMDKSGARIKSLFDDAGIPVIHYLVIPDNIEIIRDELRNALEITNCIIFTGGTGLTHDDCTIEAILPLLDKVMDGFGELFRYLSYKEIGTRSLLSRAVGGIINGKAVFCIPGSVGAATLATEEIIIPEINHILTHAGK